MNAERLLAHYERIADAPDAIARLRRFVLDLAVRGKLLPQDADDEPASELLNRLDRQRRHKRTSVQIGTVDTEVQRPNLPQQWIWTTADQLAADDGNAITDGPFGSQLKTDHYIEESSFRVIRLQNIGIGIFREEHRSYISELHFDRLSKHHVKAGDLVVAGLVDPSVRCCQIPSGIGPALVKADCYRFAVHPDLSSRYVLYCLNSPLIQNFAAVHHHGMTLKRIGLGNFRRLPLPLPPVVEQHRIVDRIEELMSLCDRLETVRAGRDDILDRLTAASFTRLNLPDSDALQANIRFIVDTLPALSARPDQLKALRQAILNLAVRGKLVPQHAHDEPASELLRRITAEKARLAKAGPQRAERDAQRLTSTAKLFELPVGWAWTPLQSICLSISDGDHQAPPKAETGVPFLVIGDVRTKTINYDADRKVPQTYFDALDPIRKPRKGDLLYTLVGSFGIPVSVLSDRPFCIQRHIGIIRPAKYVDSRFLALLLESEFAYAQAEAAATGIAQKTVSLTGLRSMAAPLPPLAEQHRIVAKVDALMSLCDRLEAALAAADSARARLLEALLAEALDGADAPLLAAAE